MKQIVIMPGGFHPFHAGHASLYNSAKQAFPNSDVYVAATNDQKKRPFPFAIKEKLAKIAGVDPGHFVQVKSPFKADEITKNYDPNKDILVFVRSEKDKNEQPKPGGTKKDGSPAYFQPYNSKNLKPFSKHAYIAYLPTVEFGPGIKSASEIREMWPTLSVKEKGKLVAQLYPSVLDKKHPAKLLANIVKMIDMGMGEQEGVAEGKMKPTHVTGKEKPGAVMALEKALLKAKNRGIKLDYGKIDKMMQLICREYHLTGDKLHNDFVKKHHTIPDNWIKKQPIKESFTKYPDYLPEK
jgi:cytidyltransferase-like protein